MEPLLQSVGDGLNRSAAVHTVQIAVIGTLKQWDFAESVISAEGVLARAGGELFGVTPGRKLFFLRDYASEMGHVEL